MDWNELKILAARKIHNNKLSEEYIDRLKTEITEIEKQGANNYWLDIYNSGKKWDTNPKGLVFPWLLDMTKVDPITTETTYIISEDGTPGEIMDIGVDGKTFSIPVDCLVMTKRGTIKVRNLQIGDELI